MGKVWVKPHTRNGKKTKGYWRNTSGSSSVSAPTKRKARRVKDTGKLQPTHILTPAQIAKAKASGVILHQSGKAVYYDQSKNDFYVTTSWSKPSGSAVVDKSTGTGRIYFKKNKRENLNPLFQ